MHSMPFWKPVFDGTPLVKALYRHPLRAQLLRRPDRLCQARGHRWGHGSPQTRRPCATSRLWRWPPLSHALVRSHAMVIRQRPPPWCLEPCQVLGTAVRAPCEAPMTRPWCAVIPLDTTGLDGPADRRVGQTCGHRCWGPDDDRWAHVHHAPARAPVDALGVPQTGRGPPPCLGRGAPVPLAWRVRPCPVGVPPGVPVGRPWSAGAPRPGVSRDRRDTSPQPLRTGRITCADDACQDHAPAGGHSAPHPGVPSGFAIDRGAGQTRCLGRHDTPPRLAWACAPRPIVPAVPHDGATVTRDPRPPGTDRLRVHGDDSRGRAPRMAFRQRAHRGRTRHRLGLQAIIRGAVTHDHTRVARVTPRPRLPTAATVLDHLPSCTGLPIPAPVAVRTVQSFPLHGWAPSCHSVFARGGTINRQ